MRASAIDAASLLLVRLVARSGSFLFFFLLARWAPPSVVGEYSYYLAVALIVAGLVDYGLPTLVTRDVSADSTGTVSPLRSALRVRAVLVAIAIAFAVGGVIARGAGSPWFMAIGIALVFDGYAAVFVSGPRRDRRILALATVEFSRSWFAVVCLCVAVLGVSAGGRSVLREEAFLSVLIASVTSFVVSIIAARRFLKEQFRLPAAATAPYWIAGLPLALATVAAGLNNRVDLIMLEWLRGMADVAHYAGAYLFVSGALLIPVIVSFAVLPTVSRARSASATHFADILQAWIRILAALAAGVGVLLAASGPIALRLLYPPSYSDAATSLQVLAVALPSMFISNLLWNALVILGRQKLILTYIGAAVVVNGACNILLVPKFGILGAAVSTLVAECLVLALAARTLSASTHSVRALGPTARALLVVAVTSVTAIALDYARGAIASATVSILVGTVMTPLLGVIRLQDIRDIDVWIRELGDSPHGRSERL
jgi:O-antigen/teichoic acid export membrane protein